MSNDAPNERAARHANARETVSPPAKSGGTPIISRKPPETSTETASPPAKSGGTLAPHVKTESPSPPAKSGGTVIPITPKMGNDNAKPPKDINTTKVQVNASATETAFLSLSAKSWKTQPPDVTTETASQPAKSGGTAVSNTKNNTIRSQHAKSGGTSTSKSPSDDASEKPAPDKPKVVSINALGIKPEPSEDKPIPAKSNTGAVTLKPCDGSYVAQRQVARPLIPKPRDCSRPFSQIASLPAKNGNGKPHVKMKNDAKFGIMSSPHAQDQAYKAGMGSSQYDDDQRQSFKRRPPDKDAPYNALGEGTRHPMSQDHHDDRSSSKRSRNRGASGDRKA